MLIENVLGAAEALKLTAPDLLELGIIDKVVAEPVGGAQRNKEATIAAVGEALEKVLREIIGVEGGVLRARWRERFLEMGKKGLG